MTTQKQILLECTICLEEFKDPRIIDCHHSFCLLCLTDFIKKRSTNGRFNCPICRVKISVPSGGATAFPTNFYINVIRENYKGEENSAISSKDFCNIHPKKMFEFYCVDCEAILCSKCVIAKHKPHTVLDVDLPEVKQMIYDKMATARVELKGIHKTYVDRLDNTKELLKLSVAADEKEISSITNHVEDLCRQVRETGNELIADIRKDISDNNKAVDEFQNKVKRIDGFMDEKHSLLEMVGIIQSAKQLSDGNLNPPMLQLSKFRQSESSLFYFQFRDMFRRHCIRLMQIPVEKIHFGQTSYIPEFSINYMGVEYCLASMTLLEDLYLTLVEVCEECEEVRDVCHHGRVLGDDGDDKSDDMTEMSGDGDHKSDDEKSEMSDDGDDKSDDMSEMSETTDFNYITLLNNINEKETIRRSFEYGCCKFIDWTTLMDPANGFLDTGNMLTVAIVKFG